jgi:hypothetical protein
MMCSDGASAFASCRHVVVHGLGSDERRADLLRKRRRNLYYIKQPERERAFA